MEDLTQLGPVPHSTYSRADRRRRKSCRQLSRRDCDACEVIGQAARSWPKFELAAGTTCDALQHQCIISFACSAFGPLSATVGTGSGTAARRAGARSLHFALVEFSLINQ